MFISCVLLSKEHTQPLGASVVFCFLFFRINGPNPYRFVVNVEGQDTHKTLAT